VNIIKKNSLEKKTLLNSIEPMTRVAGELRSSKFVIVLIIVLKKNIIFFKLNHVFTSY
jgi:hypothetical protein